MQIGKTVKYVVMAVMFGLLIIAFALSGITQDVLRPVAQDTVAEAGGREVSGGEFKALFDRQRESAAKEIGRPLTPEEAVARQMDRGLLEEMLNTTIFHALFDKIGIKASPKVVAKALRNNPDFFDPVSGRFDQTAYQRTIAEYGWTPRRFEELQASGIATDHFAAALRSGLRPPLSFVALQGAVQLEARDARFIYVTPAMVGAIPEPTEAQLRGLMAEFAPRLQRPETRELTYIRISAAKYLAEAKADPAEVQKLVDFRKSQAGKPETRTLVQIPAKDKATGDAIAARLNKGEDPEAVAKSVGAAVVRYDNKAKADLPDRKIAEAAFALQQGKVSAPIQGDLGMAVVKVVSITASEAGAVDALRTQAEQDLKKRNADTKVTEIADKLEAALGANPDLAAAAKSVGLTPTRTPLIDIQGRGENGQPVAGLSQKLVEKGFGLPSGATSEFEAEQPGEYFIVRAEKIVPPALPAFEDIRPALTNAWKLREADKRLAAKGEELTARLRKGETLEAVAASLGTQVGNTPNISRAAAQQLAQSYGPEYVTAVLTAKKGDVAVTRAPQPGLLLVKVENIRAADVNDLARGASGAREQFKQLFGQDLVTSFAMASRNIVKNATYPDRVRAIIGVEPTAEDEKAKGKAK